MVVEHDADRDLVVLAHRDALGPRDAEPEERNRLADEKDEAAHCKGCEPPRGAQRALGHAGEAREVALVRSRCPALPPPRWASSEIGRAMRTRMCDTMTTMSSENAS